MYQVNTSAEQALRTYMSLCAKRRLADLLSFGRGRRALIDLAFITDQMSIRAQRYAGVQAVPIAQIRGSEGRSDEFDTLFRPRRSHTEKRWLGIAIAWLEGVEVPPVDLIQIEDIYFVRDGHHRVSVLRALGQRDIDATVTVWQVDGALPWRQPRHGVADTLAPTYRRVSRAGKQLVAASIRWLASDQRATHP
jgi:hypothetical protein